MARPVPTKTASGGAARPPAASAPPLLKERAYRELKELIQAGELTAESTLSERQLAERLGMSKTPVRAALEHLETQGLVTVSPQRGILVRDLSARDIAELFDVRAAVEPHIAGQLARGTLPPARREEVETNLRRQHAAATAGDALEATRLDFAFHRLLAALYDNRELNIWLERCFDRLHRSVLHVNRQARNRLLKSYQEHEGVAAAVLGGRADEAPRLMREHLAFGRQFLLLGDTPSVSPHD
jgi:DNA-binding GntR family transcriptional regulator